MGAARPADWVGTAYQAGHRHRRAHRACRLRLRVCLAVYSNRARLTSPPRVLPAVPVGRVSESGARPRGLATWTWRGASGCARLSVSRVASSWRSCATRLSCRVVCDACGPCESVLESRCGSDGMVSGERFSSGTDYCTHYGTVCSRGLKAKRFRFLAHLGSGDAHARAQPNASNGRGAARARSTGRRDERNVLYTFGSRRFYRPTPSMRLNAGARGKYSCAIAMWQLLEPSCRLQQPET
jgi:hypothetical protein